MKKEFQKCVLLLLCICLLATPFAGCKEEAEQVGVPTAKPTAAPVEKNKLNDLDGVKLYEEGDPIEIAALPSFYGGRLAGRFAGTDSSVVYLIKNTTEEMFLSYLKRLQTEGYTQYTNNIINEVNLYTTYTKDDLVLTVYYTPHNQSTRIISDPETALPHLASENTYEKKTDSMLTQVKLDSLEVQEGMSYVFRLADNSFFLIDGGWPEKDYAEADKLYELLCRQSGQTENITIAGWLMTHAHGDHIGTFNDFVDKYSDKVNIKQLIYNFPADEDIRVSDSAYMLDTHKARLNAFRKNIQEHLSDVPVVKVHSGQKFYLANAEIEILFTMEDMYPQTIRNTGMNGTSTIFTVTIEGQRILFFGDSAVPESNAVSAQYGEFLKSDMMQVVHHGYGGGTVALYKNVAPRIVLYPVASASYRQNAAFEDNKYLLNEESVQQILVMGFAQYELKLPYVPAADAERIPDNKYPGVGIEQPTPTAGSDPTPAPTEKPVDDPNSSPVPYFDLEFKEDGSVNDKQGNVYFTMEGGTVGMNTVLHDGKEYTVRSYRATKGNEYLEAFLEDMGSASDWADFLLGGCTFEMFVQVDRAPTATVGLLSSCNSGGATLYIRQQTAQLNFQIGNESETGTYYNPNYSMAQPDDTSQGARMEGGRVIHVVGTYDPKENTLNLYVDGELVSSGDYGDDGAYKQGSADFSRLGIGTNISYPSESLGSQTPYTVIRSRIYNKTLTEAQVSAEYAACIGLLKG